MSCPPANLKRAQMEVLIRQQGDEIRHFSRALAQVEAANEDLKEEIRALKIQQADLTLCLNGARSLINEHKLLNADEYRPYRPLRTPAYKKHDIAPFYLGGKIPAIYLHKITATRGAQRKDFKNRAIIRLGAETMWGRKYDTCTVVRPNKLRDAQGTWHPWAHRNIRKVNHVVALMDGRAFYVGAYKCVYTKEIDVETFGGLPKAVQTAVCARMDTNAGTRAESETLLRNGQVPMTRFTLQRVGYDEKLQTALLKINARNKASALDKDFEDFEESEDDQDA